ncbi:MAG: class I SAM-dependent methyltransferase [Terriglobales bacterium]
MSASKQPDWGSSYRMIAAETWKAKSAAMGRDVTEALVDYAQPRPGMKVLDLAAGTGEPAISLAPRVEPGGEVTALDLSSDLLEIAAGRARERQLANFVTKQADAHQLPFPDGSFDLVTSRFGVMFFQTKALQEARRVLKTGARACFVAWGPFEQPFWSSMLGVAHKYAGGERTPPGQDPCRYGQPGSLSAALGEAGFQQIEEATRTLPWTWNGPAEEVWEQTQVMATPFLPMIKRVPAEKLEQLNREVLASVSQHSDGGAIKFGAVVVLASGTKS